MSAALLDATTTGTAPAGRIATLDWCAARSPWRIGVPLAALRRRGVEVRELTADEAGALEAGEVLVIYQPSSAAMLALIEQLRARGVRVVVDSDDLLLAQTLPPNAHFAAYWTRPRAPGEPTPLALLHACLAAASTVTVSTEPLAAAWRRFNPDVRVLPNCWDDADPLWDVVPPARPWTAIGFLGTEHHAEQLRPLAATLAAVLAEFPDVRLVEAGDAGLVDSVTAPLAQRLYLGTLPFASHPLLLHQFDIVLAPLADTPFARAKSNIRCMTAGLVGAPVVASPVGAYRDYVEDGVNGYLCETPAEWHAALRTLVADPTLRRAMGARNRERAREFAIARHVERWMDVYGCVLDRRRHA